MDYWLDVWERKGRSETSDLQELDGFETTDIDPLEVSRKIVSILEIRKESKVLEVGCGAGMIAQYLNCDYKGIDYSRPLLRKHAQILGNSVLSGEAIRLSFRDKSFDKAFAFSVFHYFPDKEYVHQAICEMKRVAKQAVLSAICPSVLRVMNTCCLRRRTLIIGKLLQATMARTGLMPIQGYPAERMAVCMIHSQGNRDN